MKTISGPRAALPLSSEIGTGLNTDDGLAKLRTRLLDLTNRNRLLNFRHSPASSLRVVDIDGDSVFERLLEGEKLELKAVPVYGGGNSRQPIDEGSMLPSKLSAADYAKQLGWRTDYDLSRSSETPLHDIHELPTLHYWEALEALTRKIGSAAKSAIEESGANVLHLIFGFLE